MATDVLSLAYYVSRAKKSGIAKNELAADGDYHDLLPCKIDLQAAVNLWNEMYDDLLMPLPDIDLPQADFLDIADQSKRRCGIMPAIKTSRGNEPKSALHQPGGTPRWYAERQMCPKGKHVPEGRMS